jgi:hypothetical protein
MYLNQNNERISRFNQTEDEFMDREMTADVKRFLDEKKTEQKKKRKVIKTRELVFSTERERA